MKKKTWQYLLIIGSSISLATATTGGLTAGILRYNETHRWSINPYQNYDFNQAKDSLLKAKVPLELVDEYLALTKKITGVIKTNEVIKASELLTLDNKIMNVISQRIIWNSETPIEIQEEINFTRPILTQFYEYYNHVYIYQNDLNNDSLNQMQLKSANTDLYKWSIGANISNYQLIKNYLQSAQEAWISKMKMNYIFQTFLNKKTVWYNSLISQANDKIIQISKQIQQLAENRTQLLIAKDDAQNRLLLVNNFVSSANSWEISLDWLYGLTIGSWAAQLAMMWMPPVAAMLKAATLVLGLAYSGVEMATNIDLELQTTNIHNWVKGIKFLRPILEKTFKKIIKKCFEAYEKALEIALKIEGWIMEFAGMILLTADYWLQKDMLSIAKSKFNNDIAVGLNDYIQILDEQINDISETINNLNVKKNNYANQKTLFISKLNDLSNYNKFLNDFEKMNDSLFTQTNIFTADQIKDWKKEAEKEYGYLTENSVTTKEFIEAFIEEKNDFSNKYLDFQNKEKDFINNYNNNDKEYFLKNLLLYIESPLKNNDIYFGSLNINWNSYDDIFKE